MESVIKFKDLMKRHPILVVTIVWAAGVAIHASIFISNNAAYVRAHPEIEWYARSYSFQLLNFCATRLPIWIFAYPVGLVAIAAAKATWLRSGTKESRGGGLENDVRFRPRLCENTKRNP